MEEFWGNEAECRSIANRIDAIMSRTRYETKEAIEEQIDKYTDKVADYRQIAGWLEIAATTVARDGQDRTAKIIRERADLFIQTAAHAETVTLKKLGEKLAEFMTTPIPGVLPDGSVAKK